jgi:predicted dehydrogenase
MGKPGVEVAALCDVDEARIPNDAREVEKKYGRKPEIYKDFRKILERKDIDAIIIGTPDHWHALPQILACEAGKDAYCEKPISHDIVEAKAMDAAVKRFNRIVQVGTWQRSTREFTDAVAYVRAGKLGKVVLCRAWKTDTAKVGNQKPSTPPSTLDYDFWTGPAEKIPYAPNHVHSNWRWFLNYGTGMTGDWGVHMMDIALLGMSKDTDLVMPYEVTSYGGRLAFPEDDRTAPDTVQTILRFRDPDFVLHWETGRDHPGRPDHGTEFVSADGRTLRVWRGGWLLLDPDGKELPKEQAPPTNDHWQNWLDCVRSREQPRSNLASMAQTTITCHLGNCALLAGKSVRWSKEKMEIEGKAGKNTSSYERDYRKPWKLPVFKV